MSTVESRPATDRRGERWRGRGLEIEIRGWAGEPFNAWAADVRYDVGGSGGMLIAESALTRGFVRSS